MDIINSNEFLNSVLTTDAWKELSGKMGFSMAMLEKYADHVDWEEITHNNEVVWTIDGLSKFANKINWERFSLQCPGSLIAEAPLRKFSAKWDWENLSSREELFNNWSLLEKFADRVVWAEIIRSYRIERPVEFFNHFQQYIPMAKLQGSSLWDSLVEELAKQLALEVRSGD